MGSGEGVGIRRGKLVHLILGLSFWGRTKNTWISERHGFIIHSGRGEGALHGLWRGELEVLFRPIIRERLEHEKTSLVPTCQRHCTFVYTKSNINTNTKKSGHLQKYLPVQ